MNRRPDRIVMLQADDEIESVDLIQDFLGDAAQVGTDLPHNWTPTDESTFVQVAHDGTPDVHWPIRTISSIRVTVWARRKSTARVLANLLHGFLLAAGKGYRPSTGMVHTLDPRTSGRLSSFTLNRSSMTEHIEAIPTPNGSG